MSCESCERYDIAVLGGGSAGFAAAIKAAELGARVALIEGSTFGGTCVNIGCVPSKTLIRAAETAHRRVHHPFEGIARSDGVPDWPAVRTQKDGLVTELREAKYWNVLRAYDSVTPFEQRAEVTSDRSVRLADGSMLEAGKVIVTTGASPWMPPIPGLADASPPDSATAMALDRMPASLVVIGGSSVGLELAQMFARLGATVTVLEALPNVVPAEEPEIGAALVGYLRDEGLAVHTGVTISRVERSEAARTVLFRDASGTEHRMRAEQILVAAGRRANTGGFGLETAGVRLGAKREIVVNEFLQTSSAEVYAAGDVIGDPMLVYVAAYGGALAAENALSGNVRRYDLTALPKVTFTDPAVASVGLTAETARGSGIEPIVSTLGLEHVPRSLAARDTRGFIKLVADAATRRIVGAHILAAEAGEMITESALAIKHGLTIEDLASTFHPYLTLSEV